MTDFKLKQLSHHNDIDDDTYVHEQIQITIVYYYHCLMAQQLAAAAIQSYLNSSSSVQL